MKLLQLYSNIATFKNVRFNEGFNIIVGKVLNPENKSTDTHNLGKSKLLELIDFMLLKDIGKEHFLNKHTAKFRSFTFYLEVKVRENEYVTIKRSMLHNTKVSLKKHDKPYQNFTNEATWDYSNLPINSKKDDENPVAIFNSLLKFDVLPDISFRNTVNYFLRYQNDYDEVFRLNKYSKGRDVAWKPMLYELLGFNSKYMSEKYRSEEELEQKKNTLAQVEKNFAIKPEDVDALKGRIQVKEKDLKDLERTINDFSFNLKEEEYSSELIDKTENQISFLNTESYKLRYEIEKAQSSLNNSMDFNLSEIENIFNQVNIHFPDQLKKDYTALIEFNHKLSSERDKYLQEEISENEKRLKEIKKELFELDKTRVQILSFLKEKDSLKKFKSYQSELARLEGELFSLKERLNSIETMLSLRNEINEKASIINDLGQKLLLQIMTSSDIYNRIRENYNQLMKAITGFSAILNIRQNSSKNIDFYYDTSDNQKLTAKSEGHTYKKLLCVCFDLAVLIEYKSRAFYKFVYHDGVFESLDDRLKVKYYTEVKNIAKANDLQYIVTLIEHDLPFTISELNKDDIVLELNDNPDDSGRLFGFAF